MTVNDNQSIITTFNNQSRPFMTGPDKSWCDQSWCFLMIDDKSWSFKKIPNNFWPFMAIYDISWQFMTTPDNSWHISMIYDYTWNFMTLHVVAGSSPWVLFSQIDNSFYFMTIPDNLWKVLMIHDKQWWFMTMPNNSWVFMLLLLLSNSESSLVTLSSWSQGLDFETCTGRQTNRGYILCIEILTNLVWSIQHKAKSTHLGSPTGNGPNFWTNNEIEKPVWI